MLIIHREGIPWHERAVRITDGRSGVWYVNPEAELRHATGFGSSRKDCVMSFADGLVAAGHDVLMDVRFSGRAPFVAHHRMRPQTTLVFFLVGLAWGRRTWFVLRDSLKRYVPNGDDRMRVMEHTALHYLQCSPYLIEDISLRLP